MINRILIRTRIVQIVYAWYQNRNKDLRTAEKELLFGLQKSYDLYYYLLLLMVELTNAYEARIEAKRNKYLPSDEDLNPNVRLLENRFIRQLSRNKQFNQYLNERPMSWSEHETFVKPARGDTRLRNICKICRRSNGRLQPGSGVLAFNLQAVYPQQRKTG